MLSKQITARSNRAAIHAANLTKNKRGTRIQQDIAASCAKQLVKFGYSAATAIETGYRTSMGLQGILYA